jgi:hypothetical protein
VAQASASSLTVDDYIPLSWRCGNEPTPLYWRTGDIEFSLLEIGLVPSAGLLCRVVIVTAHGCLRDDGASAADYLARAKKLEGLPVCDTQPWLQSVEWPDMRTWEQREGDWMFDRLEGGERVIDEPGTFTVAMTTTGVAVWLSAPSPLDVCYTAPGLQCGVDASGALRLMYFNGLTEGERHRMAQGITRSLGEGRSVILPGTTSVRAPSSLSILI